MRYLLVDHITEISEDFIKGVKNITMSEDFLELHFPDQPVMPGALLLEALVQLAGWFEAGNSGLRNWTLLRGVKKCSFYGFALPGDQVTLEVKPLSAAASGTRHYRGAGKINGKRKMAAIFQGQILPISQIEDADSMIRLFRILTRRQTFLSNG